MKRTILLFVLIYVGLYCSAQQLSDNILHENYASEAIKGVYIQMPDYREISSGSVVNVTYEGD